MVSSKSLASVTADNAADGGSSRFGSAVQACLRGAIRIILRRRVLLIGVVVIFLLLVLARGSWLSSANMLNPDEAQLLAAGKEARFDIVPYHTYATYTYLFLWPVFLAFISLLGVPLTLTTAHVMAGLLDVFVVGTGWYLISKEYGWRLASAVLLPTTLFFFADADQSKLSLDLYSLTTESLPIAIVFLGLAVLMCHGELATRRFLVGSAICGVSVLAKPQVGPLALALVFSCALIRMTDEIAKEPQRPNLAVRLRRLGRDVATGTIAFATPTLIAIAFLATTGEFSNFVHLGLGGTAGIFSYVSSGNAGASSVVSRLSAVLHYVIQLHVALYWSIAGIVGWRAIITPQRWSLSVLRVVVWVLPLLATIGILAVLPMLFLHYSGILFAASMISGVLGARVSRYSPRCPASARWRERVVALASLAAAGGVLADSGGFALIANSSRYGASEVRSLVTTGHGIPDDAFIDDGSALPQSCPAGSRVFVYGWANDLYSYYSWTPVGEFLVENWGLPNTASARTASMITVAEVDQARPQCIVDTVGPGFFGSIPVTDTIERILPGIEPLLMSCYRQRATTVGTAALGWTGESGQTVRYWVRRSVCT